MGRIVEIYGPESSGKTTLSLHSVAEAQKKAYAAIEKIENATAAWRDYAEVIVCADREWLFRSLGKIGNKNAKGEYYLTDLVGIALKEGVSVVAHQWSPAEDFLGINTRVDLGGGDCAAVGRRAPWH